MIILLHATFIMSPLEAMLFNVLKAKHETIQTMIDFICIYVVFISAA